MLDAGFSSTRTDSVASVSPGTQETLTFNVDVGAAAAFGRYSLDASLTAVDAGNGVDVSLPSATRQGSWTVVGWSELGSSASGSGVSNAPSHRSRMPSLALDRGALDTAEVRRVQDTQLNRVVAMKILLQVHRTRPKLVVRFREEAQCAAQLQHPGIVPVLDVGTLSDGRPYFTMAEIRGRTFGEVIAEVHDGSQATGWTHRRLVATLGKGSRTE